jgi:hypothetical protein
MFVPDVTPCHDVLLAQGVIFDARADEAEVQRLSRVLFVQLQCSQEPFLVVVERGIQVLLADWGRQGDNPSVVAETLELFEAPVQAACSSYDHVVKGDIFLLRPHAAQRGSSNGDSEDGGRVKAGHELLGSLAGVARLPRIELRISFVSQEDVPVGLRPVLF